jgi:hypothetical protein
MTPSPRASWTRRCLLAALVGLAVLTSGCVFLRLLEVKRQLGDFDRFFRLDPSEGVRLAFLTPVLLTDDLRWLGFTPESVRQVGPSQEWRVRWVKQVPPGVVEQGVRDVEIGLIFTENKLTRLLIDEAYFALIPKPFFIDLLRGLGAARIDRGNRDAAVALPAAGGVDTANLTETSLLGLLGAPTERRIDGERTLLSFRYVPTPPGARNGIFDITFSFNAAGRLVFLQGRSPVGQISFNLGSPTPAP